MIQLIHFKMIESGSHRKSFPTGHKNTTPEIKIPLFHSFSLFPKENESCLVSLVMSDEWFVSPGLVAVATGLLHMFRSNRTKTPVHKGSC